MRIAAAALALFVAVSAGAATIAPGDVADATPGTCCCILCPPPPPMMLLSNTLSFKSNLASTGFAAFGPGNRLYVTNNFSNKIDVYDSALNKTQITTAVPSFSAAGLAVFANGNLLVLTAPTLYILSPSGATLQTFVLPGAGSGVTGGGIDLAPDQCTVLYLDSAGNGRRFDVCTGQPLANLAPGPWSAVRAFADGGYVAARNATLNIFDASDHLLRTLTPQIDQVTALAFDVNPRYVWVGTIYGVAKVGLAAGDRPLFGGLATTALAVNGEQRPASALAAVQDIPALSPGLLFAVALGLIALAWLRLRA